LTRATGGVTLARATGAARAELDDGAEEGPSSGSKVITSSLLLFLR